MQSTVALFKRRSKSPGGRHDVTQKFWAGVIPVKERQNYPLLQD